MIQVVSASKKINYIITGTGHCGTVRKKLQDAAEKYGY
jgi:hypothetical protein